MGFAARVINRVATSDADRRQLWADRENQRLSAHHRQTEEQWESDRRLLQWMLATARSGAPVEGVEPPFGFKFKRGEQLRGAFAGCLVEADSSTPQELLGESGFSFLNSRSLVQDSDAPTGERLSGLTFLKVLDRGALAVTDRRLSFPGSGRRRDWDYAKAIQVLHHPTRPITLLPVTSRQRASGVSYPAADAAAFRFVLELAVAQQNGTVASLIRGLESEEAKLLLERPLEPRPLSAAQAPAASGAASLILAMRTEDGRVSKAVLPVVVGIVVVGGLLGQGIVSAAQPGHSVAASAARSTSASPTVSSTVAAKAPARSSTPPAATRFPTPTPTPTPDIVVKKFKSGARPRPPKLLATRAAQVRVGATCRDGSSSSATGRGACSWHGGVAYWETSMPDWVYDNKAKNARRTKAYKASLKRWEQTEKKNRILKEFPCSKGPYKKGSSGYASWRDSNKNRVACDQG